MISRKNTNLMFAAAALLAAVLLMLSALRILHAFGWIEYSLLAAIVVLVIVAGYSKLQYRSQEMNRLKSVRASLLKDLWEKRQKREW
jgi:hypothetical protein